MDKSLDGKPLNIRIRLLSSTMSEKEHSLADYILKSPDKIVHGTINQVAEELNVADSTVFRFCKRLGYKGFQDMKISLAAEASSNMGDLHELINVDDDKKTVLEKVFHFNIKTLEDTLKVIDENEFKKAADTILKARKIEFFGFGGSNIIALDGYHKFIRTGLTVNAQIDSHLQLMSASQLKENDVAILISHTGQSKDILDILTTVKENNVSTIGITGYTQSPLSQSVDIPLYTLSEETDYRSEALASRIAQLSILDALFVNLMVSLDEQGVKSLQKVRKAIQNKRL
ncbi:MAG: MurR/RpiR family transcriptional regulator [Alkalibacterium sp.]|nr:MurR/RpiR family transcriptional regulator [Alkalibacterium sp.]